MKRFSRESAGAGESEGERGTKPKQGPLWHVRCEVPGSFHVRWPGRWENTKTGTERSDKP